MTSQVKHIELGPLARCVKKNNILERMGRMKLSFWSRDELRAALYILETYQNEYAEEISELETELQRDRD